MPWVWGKWLKKSGRLDDLQICFLNSQSPMSGSVSQFSAPFWLSCFFLTYFRKDGKGGGGGSILNHTLDPQLHKVVIIIRINGEINKETDSLLPHK